MFDGVIHTAFIHDFSKYEANFKIDMLRFIADEYRLDYRGTSSSVATYQGTSFI